MSERELNRREFLKRTGALAALGLGVGALAGCGGKGEPCSDLSGLTAAEREVRVVQAYRSETLIPAKRCDNCNFWKAPAPGQDCGSCTVVKGPIAAGGYCNSWAQPVAAGEGTEAS